MGKIYIRQGKKYDIPEDKVEAFTRRYPTAVAVDDVDFPFKNLMLGKETAPEEVEQVAVGNPMQPTQAEPQQQPVTQSVAQPQGLNKALASARVSLAYNSPLGNTDAMIRQSKQIADSATRTAAVTGTVQRDVQYNPVSNQFEQMYVTPNGAVTPNKALADYETNQFREYRRATDMSLGGQLQRAEDELRELQEQYKKASQNTVRTTSARAFMPTGVRTHDEAVSADNNELNTLWTTIRQKQEQIQMLRNKISADNDADNLWGDTRRFFRHAGQAVFNTDAWDFGLGALGDATTMLRVAQKAQQGTPLTENEQNLLENIYLTQNIQSQYGDLGDAAQYGEMGGQMLSFMKDMALFNVAGGANIGANLTKNLIAGMAKKGTSSLAKRFASEGTMNFIRHNGLRGVRNLILEQGAGRAVSMATTRALGVAAEDLLIKAPVMTATIQAGNLAADIIETKLGPVQYDDNTGQFNFVNDTSWGEAAWEQSADRIIENASEMIGGRWDFFKGFGLDDVERIFGANHVVSRMLRATPETLSTAVNKTSDILSKFGFNGVPGEVAEEYWGQFARTMSGLESAYMPLYDDNGKPIFERDGEGKIVLDEEGNPVQAKQNLFESGEFHKDIWGGIALTAGMMQTASTGMVYGGMALNNAVNNAANKKMLNKALRMSDIRANALLTPEIWEPLREALSAMDNEDVIDMTDWIRHDNDFTDKQRDAAMSYIWNLLQQRGSNLMELAEKRNGVFTEYAEEWGNAYNNGYETVEAEQMQDIRNMYDYQRNRLSQLLTPEEIASIDADAANYLSGANIGNKKRDAVLDYVNAKQVYDGMQQRGTDDVDIAIEQSNALIDSHTHQDSNQVQSAIMKEGDRKVYIMKGNVITRDDGTIDVSNSDDSIIVRDAETGEMIQMSPELLLQVDEVQDASEQKALAENEIRTRMDQEFNDKVNGTVYFNAGDVYNIVDDSGNPAQLTVTPNKEGIIDNGDGTVNVTSDGVNVVAMNKETIQEMVDAANIGRIANNEVERTTKLAAQTTQPQPTDVDKPQTAPESSNVVAPTAPQMPTSFNFGDEITIVDDNGNPVTATITFVNEDGYNLQLPQGSTLGGYNVAVVKPDEIQDVLYNPNAPVTEVVAEQPQDVSKPMQPTAEEIPVAEEQNVAQPTESAPITQVSAMQRIPKDGEGNLLYEQTDPQTAWDAIVEQTNGNATMAQNVVDSMVADKEAALKKVEKIQLPKGISVAEKIVAEQEKANAISQAQNELAFWQSVSQLNNVAETVEEVQPTQEEAVEEQPTEVVEESQPIVEEQPTPVKEYEDRAVDDVWNELLQDNENDVVEAVDTAKQMYNVYKTEYDKVEKRKATGKTVQEINEAKRARKAKLADLQRRMDYWQKVAERGRDLVAEQKRIEEINEATKNFAKYYSQMGEPINFHDYVLRALSGGGIKFRWADSPTGTKGLGSHLGMRSEEERRKRIWLLNNESGLYPEQVAEDLIVGYESETNSRLNIDSMEALDEVLEILRTHSTAKSMYDEVLEIQDEINQRNQREERRRYDEWCYENFGMTAEEYEAYQEVVESELRAKDFTDEEYEACNNIVAEETLNQQTIEENEDTEGNEQGRNDELRTGSDEVLPSEESVSSGGIGETESNGGSEADVNSDSENGAVSESTSGEQVEETTKSEQVHKKVAEGTNGERISKLPKAERAKAQRAALEELGIFAEVALPKGSKWSDGRKFGQKATRRSASTQITALVVGEDLYIKGIGLPWTNINNKNNDVYVIRNFRKWQSIGDFQMALLDHADITLTPSEDDAINTIFTENGIGFNRSITRPISSPQSKGIFESETPAENVGNAQEETKAVEQTEEKVSEEPKTTNKIEDFGEHIEGARKDLYKELAKTFDNVTIQSLIELPLSKVFKMPDLAKLVNKGVLTEEEALTIKAMQIVLLSTPKPKLSSKYSYKRQRQAREVAEWAAKTYESIELIKSYIDSGAEARAAIITSEITNKDKIDAARKERVKQLEENAIINKLAKELGWNEGQTFTTGECYTPNPIAVMVDLLKALDYKVGDKLEIKATLIKSDELGNKFMLYSAQGDKIYLGSATNYDEAFATLLWHAKFLRGDADAKVPIDLFSFIPKKSIKEGTGRYRVDYFATAKSTTSLSKDFNSKEEAEAFASKHVSIVQEIQEVVGYENYVIKFREPVTGFVYEGETEYPTKADAIEALKAQYEEINEELNAKHSELLGEKGKSQNFYEVFKTYGKQPYAVAERVSRTIVKTFATKEEAESYAAEAEKAYATYKEFMRNFVYFSAESSPRVGEDYRKGADVTPEQFSAMFGFRGVQFGNWTNDKDRQAALNQAYDAFMDLASVIGVSPRALSLNGELGIAFGARGGGSALAHYELSEVVINLTKTKGAGSLAHEWWHALDNYFSRQGGTPLGMATEGRGKEVRDKVKEAFKKVVNAIKGTEYDKRSKARGQYWGSVVEETARLFAEWVNQELSATGASNAFLSRGIDQAVIDRWIESRYNYSRLMKTIDENVTLEEFSKLPEALKGFPYPTPAEVAEMGVAVSELFDAIEEKEGLNGNIAMFQTDELEYGEELTPAQQLATASAVAMLENNGIEVVEATDEMVEAVLGQSEAEFSKKKRALETESAQKEHQPSAVSSADGAKILKNLDSIAKDYEENTKKRANTFLGDLGKVLGTKKYGSNSRYATFETVNGKIVTIRLADHNATVSNFDNNNESDGISIVVSAKKSEGIDNDGNAHIVEYYYNAIKLRKAGGKPLAEIVKSIKQALYSGEYIDNTGLAEREEVNLNSPQFHIVYHGTGTKFDAFDHSHMGEGEGAQAYGWGTYVTEVEGIAKVYAKTYDTPQTLEERDWEQLNENIADTLSEEIGIELPIEVGWTGDGFEVFERILRSNYKPNNVMKKEHYEALADYFNYDLDVYEGNYDEFWDEVEYDLIDVATKIAKRLEEEMESPKPMLYTVEIPDDNGRNYLDYTNQIKPEQAERINLGLAEIQDRLNGYEQGDAKLMYERSGVQVYHRLSQLLGGDKQASEFLNSIGFVGIKYPAQYTMGGRSDNAKNYVVFNENDAKIVDRVEFMRTPNGTVYGWTIGGKVYLTKSGMNPNTPVHEYTHLWANAMMQKNPKGWQSIKDLLRGTPVWNEVMLDKNYANIHDNEDLVASEVLSRLSGKENAKKLEAMAEEILKESKGIFAKAEAISLIERMKEALNKFWNWVGTNLFGIDKFDSIEQVTDRVLWDMATGTDLSGVEYSDIVEAQIITDPKLIEQLESEPKIKVYRAMQLHDGKLYPPMAGKTADEAGGKRQWGKPIELGKWEQSEERPDLVIPDVYKKGKNKGKQKKDKQGELKWLFRLDKGNGTTVDAAYNPYLHTSKTPLNDQFSSAQSRPELVTVEVEVPQSELTSGYKAEKAKDSVGRIEWKAGPIQGKLSGKREVILSRYDKPIRIVPDNEVADEIIKMLEGKNIVFPSNVVTPSLRTELEKRGVQFVETNNQGEPLREEDEDVLYRIDWSDKTAENAVLTFKEHFPNAGEVVIFNSPNELYDFGRRLGEPEEDINDYLKRVEDVEVAASYSPDLDKMLIFAWQHANFYQTLFHENVHRAINKLGGIENFMDLAIALKYFDIELFNKLFKYYSQDEINDEVITYSLEYAFAGNALESLKTVLSEKAIEQLNEILNYIGYETGRDTATEIERFERHPNSKEFEYVRGRTRRLSREFSEKNERRKLAEIYSSNTFQSKTERTLGEGSEAEGADRELEDLYRNSEEDQAYAERMRSYMRSKVRELAERLGVNIEIVEDASTLKGKKSKAKGFFNPRTGTITVVLPNNSSIADVEQTVFHEAVAHYGLRQLFGDKFDEFLDEVYEFAEPEIRERIARMALRGGLDIRKATEEYLATLAEDTKFFESSPAQLEWFAKIKRAFIKMLRTIGLNYMVPRMSDNELRYFLWLSYENLRGKAMPIFKEAAQITKQQELGLDNYGQSVDKTDSVTDSEEVLYRKGETPREKYERVTRRPTINNDVKLYHNLWNRFVEAYQDKMQSLSALQNAVAEESGKPIKPHEDAYTAENRMSSENKAQAEIYKRDFLGPLMNVITNLIKNKKVTYQDIKDYLIAKHGLERNDHMAMRDAKQQALKDLGPEPERPTSYLDADYDAKQQAWEDWNIAYTEAVKTNYEANRQRDYAGLTGLTKSDNVADAEAKAEQIVADFENKCGNQEIIDLWNVVNNATKATLRKQFESGLISKSTYENVQNMYEYYVPLRGWDAETAEDNYDYLLSSSVMLPPVFKTAKGRSSLAEDPIAMIGFMAEAAIIKGNRNLMKQRFLAMARNHQTDLLTITEQWYKYDVSTDSWVPSFPQIPADATAEQIAQAITEHEERMEEAEKNGTATKNTQGLKLGMHILEKNAQEHCVRVLQNGKEYCIYVNGNPRAAQALNGLTNPNMNDGNTKRFVESLKNGMAQLLTSKNPAFVITNLSRDILWAGTSVMIKEDAKYVAQYTKNISKALTTASIPRLLKKFNDGTLDESIPEERMFAEFIRNGGETGFTQINTVENYKRDIKRMIKDSQSGPVNPRKVWNAVWNGVEFLNRSAEDTTRFMVYMTSRQMGRTVAESINDAKEITVNFNRKGSGGMGARLMSFAYIFFNAAVQSLANFGKLLKNHPVKTTAALLTFASAGLIAPTLNLAMQAMFGGDDDDTNYWDLPEWVRRNNIVLWFPFSDNGYLTIPLPHELRPFYGMGEIAMSIIYGKENVEDGLAKATQSFASLLPLDFTGNGGNLYVTLAPSVLQPIEQVRQNVDFFGVPIYKKNAWNEGDPEYTKAYSGTSTWLVDATRWLNDFTREKGQEMSGDIDLNPAIIEHLFEAYTGGVGKTINRTAKTIGMIWDEDLQEVRNVPVLSSFYRTVDNKSANSQVNREYFDAIEEMKNTQATERQFKKNKEAGILGYAEELAMLQNSDLYKRYKKIKKANKDVNKWQEKLKTANPHDAEDIENRILQIKVDMLEELERIENEDVRK